MKITKLLIIALSFIAFQSEAQVKSAKTPQMGKNVQEVKIKNETYYLTKDIGYSITGKYFFESTKEPIVQLNSDGTGLFQLHEMSPTPMVWGIECEMNGTPKKLKTDWGFMYSLWYQIKAKHQGASWESGVIDDWDVVSFSVHTDESRIYILGERIKSF